MIPDCRKRLQLATDELLNYVVSLPTSLHALKSHNRLLLDPFASNQQQGLQDSPQVNESSELVAAKQLLTETQAQLDSPLPVV